MHEDNEDGMDDEDEDGDDADDVCVIFCSCVYVCWGGEGLHGGQGCVRGFTIMLHQLLSGCVPAWANALSAHPCHHTMAINTQAH